jgi:serine/threonine protein kinase
MEFSPGDTLGRYRIQRLIGVGVLANVYLATDSDLRRSVALKVNRRDSANDPNSPLLNAARILAQLQHAAIVNIFDVGRHHGQLFLVFEYLDGGTLRSWLQDEGAQISHKRAVDIVASIADALDYVHRRGYLHRNIKPDVIFQDSSGQPRLSGFEVAVQKAELASAMAMAGTPAYMAPEQFADDPEQLGPHTDVWGLGVTLYEALTGRRPYGTSSLYDLRRLIVSTEPALPSSMNAAIPPELDRICLKCLSKKPKDRYRNAALLAGDLRTWQQAAQPRKQRRVFVSHSTKDRDFVEREVITQLEKHGIRTWYSKVDIQTASEWERSILRGLESCEWFLVVMSPRSSSSEWVKDELHWAIDNRPNRIIPVLMDDCNLSDFHIRMGRIQYVDFRNRTKESRAQLLALFEADAA